VTLGIYVVEFVCVVFHIVVVRGLTVFAIAVGAVEVTPVVYVVNAGPIVTVDVVAVVTKVA
jgi:hypothetical protein